VLVMPKRPGYLLAIALVVAVAVRFTGPQLMERFQTTFARAEERDMSAQSRLELWKDCATVMARNPVTGIGPRHWPLVAASYGWPEGKAAHTYWLEVGAEIGVPGLLSLVVFFVSSLARAWRLSRWREDPWMTAMGGFAFTGLIGFAVGAQFITADGNEIPFYLALVALASLEIARRAPVEVSEASRGPSARFPVLAQQAMRAQASRRAR
jgi:O-antigen ligase